MLDSHIEHFRPQHEFRDLELEYSNLHASCIRETGKSAPLHCGHAKDSWFDENLAISPLDDGCESRFQYSLTGGVVAAADGNRAAEKMIEVLKLDLPYLAGRRKTALAGVLDAQFIDTMTSAELQSLAAGFSRPDNGRLLDFGHVVASVCRSFRLR